MRSLVCIFLFVLYSCNQTAVILTSPAEISEEMWYTIDTDDDFSPSVFDAHAWLDAPAGKHGFVLQNDDHFEFENGTRIKFWGVNIADARSFPPKDESDQYVKYYQKYGVNAVRFHKFTWSLTENMPESVLADSVKFDKLDYFSAKLREKGIYYGWSHIYGHRVLPGDSSKLLAYEEIKNLGGAHLKGSTYNLVYFAPDLQALSIGLTVNMLNHVNPYTGLRYADDAALCFVELNNEDNLFFASAHSRIMQAPTYKKLIERMFSKWLMQKYGSHQALIDAWGKEALNAFPQAGNNEHLDLENIYPMAHHGYLSTKYLEEHPQHNKRIWDTARFLYETQVDFYSKFVEAVRQTGYKGPIVPSGWQAGDNIAHLYNLHSDYLFGFIDRHNYYGGSRAQNRAMVDEPAIGLLSSGMQQVINRPFALSEWISVMPNEWLAESAPLIAVYGMGLQGWDASYSYASNHPYISNSLHSSRHGVYNADAPTHMGLYPALSRLVYRGDVTQGEVVSIRNVHIPGLISGQIGFEERISQIYDIKEFTGTIPREALAIGRTVIKFTDEFQETIVPDFSHHWNRDQNVINSQTGELSWYYGERGFITINTPGTVGFIGFPPDSTINIGNYAFRTTNTFAVVFITSLDKTKDLRNAKQILISTFARAGNTGMEYNHDFTDYISRGSEPILMEPVNITISFPGINRSSLHVLDFQGRKRNIDIDAENNQFIVNGSVHQTNYYLLEK